MIPPRLLLCCASALVATACTPYPTSSDSEGQAVPASDEPGWSRAYNFDPVRG